MITGASGGIGEAVANQLAERKHNLVLVARNEAKLKTLSERLRQQYHIKIEIIAADLSKPNAAMQIFEETQKRNLIIDKLINNAGIGSGGEFATLTLQSELDLIQLNNVSLVALTHLFLQPMKERKTGTIVNVASMAAFMPAPYMATYAASKVFVRFFTEAITEECKPYNVQVLLFCPGLTRTNFNTAAGLDTSTTGGLGIEYDNKTQTPEQVAGEMVGALDQKRHFRVSGLRNRISAKMMALVPNQMIAAWYAKNYRKSLT